MTAEQFNSAVRAAIVFSLTLTTARKREGLIECPLCGVTNTYGVAQMLKPAA